jgi:hypothetical protein
MGNFSNKFGYYDGLRLDGDTDYPDRPGQGYEIDGAGGWRLIPLTWAQYQQQAKEELDFDDGVAIRCIKAGVPYPAAWLERDVALRIIVTAANGDATQALPVRPAYPAGT